MQKIVPFMLFFIVAACSHNPEKTTVKLIETEKKSVVVSTDQTPGQQNEEKSDTLVALELIKKDSKNVYEKYGIDFNGYCYACDAADIVIGNKQIVLVNACDRKIIESFPVLKSSATKSGMTFTTKTCVFEFKWIEAVPVYELKITGKLKQMENLRINRYFTVSEAVPKFEIHDCGDFQG